MRIQKCSIYVFKGERKLMKEKLTVLIGEKEIQSRVEKLAAEISESYKGESLLVVGILRGAIMFMVDLLKNLKLMMFRLTLWLFQATVQVQYLVAR